MFRYRLPCLTTFAHYFDYRRKPQQVLQCMPAQVHNVHIVLIKGSQASGVRVGGCAGTSAAVCPTQPGPSPLQPAQPSRATVLPPAPPQRKVARHGGRCSGSTEPHNNTLFQISRVRQNNDGDHSAVNTSPNTHTRRMETQSWSRQ